MSGATLHLVIRLGIDRYAIDIGQVVEVVPLVRLKALAGAPRGVAGVMNYRDAAVPVIDLNLLATGDATARRLGTRIVIVAYEPENDLLGLLVPAADETLRADPDQFVDAGVRTQDTEYLGPVLTTADGIVQRVSIGAVLTPELRDALFRPAGSP